MTGADRGSEPTGRADDLTGLPLRGALLRAMDGLCTRARSGGEPFAVLFVDVDGLKQMNDVFGHAAGDELLRVVAQRLCASVRSGDLVARVGGDEFVVMADGIVDEPSAVLLYERLAAVLRVPARVAGMPVRPSASVGIALADGTRDPEELVQDADLAMYSAKAEGRNRARMYDPAMRLDALDRFLTVHGLAEAIAGDELALHYQPVYHTDGLAPAGAEALLRWQNPRRGLLMPAAFLPAVDAGDLTVDVGEWVIDRVVAAAGAWRRHHDLAGYRLGMNVSPRHLRDGDVVGAVERALARHDADPEHLVVEILETEDVGSRCEVSRQIAHLREMGLRVAIDDFGSGATGLQYLRDLPVDLVKVDRRLVRADPTDRDRILLAGLVRMCDELGISVLLEGVETPMQLDLAADCGAAFVQGFLLSRPVVAEPGRFLPVPEPVPPAVPSPRPATHADRVQLALARPGRCG